jgi:hypothetical protein
MRLAKEGSELGSGSRNLNFEFERKHTGNPVLNLSGPESKGNHEGN